MLLQLVPAIAYAALVTGVLAIAAGRGLSLGPRWLVPGLLGAAFLLFSLWTVWEDGLMQFWVNHTSDLAGNQVWLDLLIAVGISFALMAPRARAARMPLLPWGIAVVLTASVALLPMLARLIWLEREGAAVPA